MSATTALSLNVDELWALVQLAEASFQSDEYLSPIELKALTKLRDAHARLFAKTSTRKKK